jgi:hypothetical protein
MTGRAGKTRNIFLVWLVWPLITLGIYGLVWWYKINREARDFDSSIEVNPVLSLLAVMVGWIIIVPPYVSIYRTGNRIAQMQRRAGLEPTCNAWIGLILGFFFSLFSLYYQSELNKIWALYGNPEEGTQVPLPAGGVPGIPAGGPVVAPPHGAQAQAYGAPAPGQQPAGENTQFQDGATQAQDGTTREPDSTTQAQDGATREPDENAQPTPDGPAQAADGNTQAHGGSAQAPGGGSQAPGTGTT